MPSFYRALARAEERAGHGLCVGLDPDPDRLPRPLRGLPAGEGLRRFLEGIIQSTLPSATAYKCQLASYLAFGLEGLSTLRSVTERLRSERPVILDLKAGDIPNTMSLYARGVFGAFGFDALTVNPFLGWESVEEIAKDPERGVFVVAHSSNPGSKDFQEAETSRGPLWHGLLERVREEADRENVGLVVGATDPSALALARRTVGGTVPILVPGVGAQGGDLETAVRLGRGAGPGTLLVNSSRGILFASEGEDFASAAGRVAEGLSRQLAGL